MPGLGREALPGTGHSDHYISQALKELEQLVLGPISSRNGPWQPKALKRPLFHLEICSHLFQWPPEKCHCAPTCSQ